MFTVWSCLFHFNQYVFTTSEFNEQFYENPSLVYVVLMLFLQLFYFYLYILGVFEAPLFYIETIIPKNIFFCQRTSFISIWNKKKTISLIKKDISYCVPTTERYRKIIEIRIYIVISKVAYIYIYTTFRWGGLHCLHGSRKINQDESERYITVTCYLGRGGGRNLNYKI